MKPLGEGPGGASSEEEASGRASRWGARGGGGPEGSLPGWRPGDSACEPALGRSPGEAPRSRAVEGLPVVSVVGAPPRRGRGGGHRVGLPGVPPRRSVGDDPVRGSWLLPPRRGGWLASLGCHDGGGPEGPQPGWRPGERARRRRGRRAFPEGLRGALGEGARGVRSDGGRSEEHTVAWSQGPSTIPPRRGGEVLQPWLSGGKSAPSGD